MKLSEAILLGSIGTTQAFKVLMDPHGGTCAMGAAYVAVGEHPITKQRAQEVFAVHGWNWLLEGRFACPACQSTRLGEYVIPHLNDTHKWTRPRVAAWVASVEPQDKPAPNQSQRR